MKKKTHNITIGADEVGFGAIAGPLVVCAAASLSTTRAPVIKHYHFERKYRADAPDHTPIQDSKKLSYNMLLRFREVLHDQDKILAYELCQVPAGQIDKQGVELVRVTAMRSVIWRLIERLAHSHMDWIQGGKYRIIVDGEGSLGEQCPFRYTLMPQADSTVWQVSAASILAKYHQIQIMRRLHITHPEYNWIKNRGYPTREHLDKLQTHGVSRHHRKSYKPVREVLNGRV